MKKIITFLAAIVSMTVYAQSEQRFDTFLAGLSYELSGDYVYRCVYSDNGKKILTGPFTMKGDMSLNNIRVNILTTGSINIDYNLSGSHNNGNINGPLQMLANVRWRLSNGSTQNDTYSFKGNFKNGYPNGNFIVNYKEGDQLRMANVTYKDTIFVGAYHCKGFDDNNWIYDYKGSFNADGKMTGEWNLNKNIFHFLNGVRISGYGGNMGEMAKKYAAGTISKKQLNEKGYYVCTDSLDLGYKAYSIILSNEINWKKLGWYTFSKTRYVKYEYLTELARISDHGIDKFIDNLIKTIKSKQRDNQVKMTTIDCDAGLMEFARYISYDYKYDEYYLTIWQGSEYQDYCRGGSLAEDIEHKFRAKVYLTKSQYEKIASAVHEFQKQNVKTMQETEKLLSYHWFRVEYLAYCDYDHEYITFDDYSDKMRHYVDVETAEKRMIAAKRYKYILDNVPDTRKEIVTAKVNEAMDSELKSVKASKCKTLDYYIEQYRDRSEPELELRSRLFKDSETFKEYFPIISYELSDFSFVDDSEDSEAKYKSEFIFNVLSNGNEFNSYKTKLYLNDKLDILCELTFAPDSLQKITNPVLDEIEELSSAIDQKKRDIKSMAEENFHISWREIEKFLNKYDLSINYCDLEGSLNKYLSLSQKLDDILLYLGKLRDIKSIYEEISLQYGNNIEDLGCYRVYIQSKAKAWTPVSKIDNLQKVLDNKENTLSFFMIKDNINQVNQQIMQSGSSEIIGPYSVWFNNQSLSWSLDYNQKYYETIISVQTNTLSLLDNIDKINRMNLQVTQTDNKNLVEPYSVWFNNQNLSWSLDYNQKYYETIISILSDTCELAEKHQIIINNNIKLKELQRASKKIYKLYSEYYKAIDLSWKEDTDALVEKYDEILTMQNGCIKVLSSENIKAISSEIGKAGVTDIMQVINQYGETVL